MNTVCVTNKNGHYFIVKIHNLIIAKLSECTLHNSLSDMYLYVCKLQELEAEEIEGNEIIFNQIEDVIWEVHSTGGGIPLELDTNQTIEDYISNYEL